MLHADWKSSPAGLEARAAAQADFPTLALEVKDLLSSLAAEIEDARTRQTRALAVIEARLAAAERSRAADPAHTAGEWDQESAEALTRAYEEMARSGRARDVTAEVENWRSWRFSDLTHQVKAALAGAIQPQVPLAQLDERMSRLQTSLGEALDDIARRSDVDGLREIANQVGELAAKLDTVQQRLVRLDQLEQGLTGMIAQVADDRVARLVQHGSRLAQDLEAMTKASAAELHASFLERNTASAAEEAERYDNLRSLIETSIQEWRQTETNAASIMQGLGSILSAQADRYDELKALIEQTTTERRQGEDQAVAMLDTLQDAMVRILDRLDGIEANQTDAQRTLHEMQDAARPAPARVGSVTPEPVAFVAEQYPPQASPASALREELSHVEQSLDFDEAAPEAIAAAPVVAPASEMQRPQSPIERMRRDLIAEAQRAKHKAAERTENSPSKADLAKKPVETGSVLSGNRARLLAAALAGVVLINGALLMFGRKSDAPPAITIEAPAATQSSSGDAPALNEPSTEEVAPPQPRSDADSAAPQKSAANSFGYGFYNDVLASPYAEPADEPAAVPSGLTIVEQGPEPEAKLAATYQQQVLAGLSGALGIAAAKSSADALLPDVNGRITPPAPELASLSDAGSESDLGSEASQNAGSSALKLPPATVGPLSLRLAAANGDPSAEFEVASRLAQGKGTDQNLSEAVRWYHRAAAKGFTQAHYRLGTLFERGLGVPKDIGRARVWYQRAAEQGNIKAMHNLAVLSAGGTGEPDYATAISWFTKAAEHGLADSQFNLGVLLENGLGLAQDRVAAYKWYALAAKGGDKDAASRRDALHASFDPETLKNAEAQMTAFKAKPSDPIANDPRVAGEDWKKRLDKEAAASPPDADRNVMGVVQ